jgi:hypothetical protein
VCLVKSVELLVMEETLELWFSWSSGEEVRRTVILFIWRPTWGHSKQQREVSQGRRGAARRTAVMRALSRAVKWPVREADH